MSFRPRDGEQARNTPDAHAEPPRNSAAGEGASVSANEERGDAYVIAQAINRAGMGGVASIVLEIARPLHWIGGQLAWVLEPLLGAFGPFSRRGSMPIEGIARLLERPDGAAELAGQLEEMSGKQKQDGGTR
jgi:hypothetical protein